MVEDKTRPRMTKTLRDESHTLGKLVNNKDLSDVVFVIGDDKIFANRCILANQSPVFRAMLFGKMAEANQKEIIIKDPHIRSDAFLSLLEYLYTGNVRIDLKNVLYLLYLAKLYDIDFLRKKARELVKEVVSDDDVMSVWDSAIALGEEEIEKGCEEIVSQNTEKILKMLNPKNLSEKNSS